MLQPDPTAHLGVRRRRERHQLVPRHVAAGQQPLQAVLDPLRQPEHRGGDPVAHLDEVAEGHRGDRLGVLATARSNSGSAARPVAAGLVEAAVELDDVLERAVGALAVERDDGVGGVAEQADPPGGVPRRGVDGAEQPDGVVLVVVDERRRQRHEVRVVGPEVPLDRRRAAQRGEASGAAVGPEQRAGERTVRVGQGDHHRRAARPDVQRARVEGELPALGRDVQLLVAVVEEVEALVDGAGAEQLPAHRGSGAVGAEHDVRRRRAPCRAGVSNTIVAGLPGRARRAGGRRATSTPGAASAASSRAWLSAARLIELIARSPSSEYGWKSSGP